VFQPTGDSVDCESVPQIMKSWLLTLASSSADTCFLTRAFEPVIKSLCRYPITVSGAEDELLGVIVEAIIGLAVFTKNVAQVRSDGQCSSFGKLAHE